MMMIIIFSNLTSTKNLEQYRCVYSPRCRMPVMHALCTRCYKIGILDSVDGVIYIVFQIKLYIITVYTQKISVHIIFTHKVSRVGFPLHTTTE